MLGTHVKLVGMSSAGRTTAILLALLPLKAPSDARLTGVGGSNHATRLCGCTHTRRDAEGPLALRVCSVPHRLY